MSYRAGRFPGRRRIPRAARVRAPRKTMPMISRYSGPLAITPMMATAIAAITSSRNKAITGSCDLSTCLAAGYPPLAASADLIGRAVVPEDRLLVAGRQFAVRVDRGAILDLSPVVPDPDVFGTHSRLVQRNESEPAPWGNRTATVANAGWSVPSHLPHMP
jgi:hypothetical protein